MELKLLIVKGNTRFSIFKKRDIKSRNEDEPQEEYHVLAMTFENTTQSGPRLMFKNNRIQTYVTI